MACFLERRKHQIEISFMKNTIIFFTEIEGIELIISPLNKTHLSQSSSYKNQYIIGSYNNPYHIQLVDPRMNKPNKRKKI